MKRICVLSNRILKPSFSWARHIVGASMRHGAYSHSNIAVAVGFDANDRVIRDLQIDCALLDLLVEEFSRLSREEKFSVYTFMEGKGLKGIQCLSGKFVEDVSASLGDARERKDTISANHIGMCRSASNKENGYYKVRAVVERCLRSLKVEGQVQPREFPFPNDSIILKLI